VRNPWQGEESSKRGRRRATGSGSANPGSPFDFSADDEQVDPVDLLAIRADDELLDALSSGRPVGPAYTHGFDARLDDGYNDDQQVLAMLAGWRADVESERFPELVSVDEASQAIVAGQRAANRPRRRLMSVAAAAAVAVMALSGVAVAAGNAQPGDPLWGVSTVIDGNRAKSVEAAYKVDLALAAAQQALAQGRVAEAQAKLASVAPELNQVRDPERKDELARKSDNLQQVAQETPEGQQVDTGPSGARRDPSREPGGSPNQQNDPRRQQDPRGASTAGSAPPSSSNDPRSARPEQDPRSGRPEQGQNPNPDRQQGQQSGQPAPESAQSSPQSGQSSQPNQPGQQPGQQSQQSGQQGQQGQQSGQQGQQGQQPGQQGQQPGQQGQQGQQGQGSGPKPDNGGNPPPNNNGKPDKGSKPGSGANTSGPGNSGSGGSGGSGSGGSGSGSSGSGHPGSGNASKQGSNHNPGSADKPKPSGGHDSGSGSGGGGGAQSGGGRGNSEGQPDAGSSVRPSGNALPSGSVPRKLPDRPTPPRGQPQIQPPTS